MPPFLEFAHTNMEKTRSEYLFERFCGENLIRYSRVDTETHTKTPDYDVFPQENHVGVEVKELQANDDDESAWSKATTCCVATACDPRNRIRQKIGVAVKQLKRRGERLRPAIIVLFDNGTFGGIDATDIKNAMYGDETWRIRRFSRGDTEIVPFLGGGRKCTATDNRSLSAVGLLWTIGETVQLSVFHNVFARCPLPYDWFANGACRQYSIDLNCDSGLPEWRMV